MMIKYKLGIIHVRHICDICEEPLLRDTSLKICRLLLNPPFVNKKYKCINAAKHKYISHFVCYNCYIT